VTRFLGTDRVRLIYVTEIRGHELKGAFAAMQAAGAGALLVMTDPLLFDRHICDPTALALEH
jgi:hypothetical protein